eukprot:TRINITY_DN23654_c0_g2_i7.p1 TRINITY_DN23654_c0_g2~~TRINITY_DN23654_c0_g2_i7.p1  ORF type:complete len:669 (-),score=83.52 TRINITY_DN23654_c0_g2_i7:823-2829(-)
MQMQEVVSSQGAATVGPTAAVCITGQLRGVCTPNHVQFLLSRILKVVGGEGGGADLFVIVPTGADCRRATSLFPNATELHCTADTPLLPAEEAWLQGGPRMCWNRQRYLLQLRLMQRCRELVLRRLELGIPYRWIMRSRADVIWQAFPDTASHLERTRGFLQLAWMPLMRWQAYADNFAIGTPEVMLPYLGLYDFVLNRLNWDSYDFKGGDKVWRRQWAHECNYPELILERYLQLAGVPVRYSSRFCFSRMRACGEKLEAPCRPEEADEVEEENMAVADFDRYRIAVVMHGKEMLPEQTFAPHHQYDAILAARLVAFFHAEQVRINRPPKIVDLGCGRGTLVQEFRIWNMLAVGLDKSPAITAVIPNSGMVLNIAQKLDFTIRTMHARCDYEPHFGLYSPGMDFESAEMTGKKDALSPVDLSPDSPMRWVHWVNYLMGRCCIQLSCVGFATNGRLKYGLQPRGEWVPSRHAWMYVKRKHVPTHVDAQVAVPNDNGPGALTDTTPDADRPQGMDWVLGLDLLQTVPSSERPGLYDNVGRLAAEGAIFTSPERELPELSEALEARGFARDEGLEAELQLFTGIGGKDREEDLVVFRRLRQPRKGLCSAWLSSWQGASDVHFPRECVPGLTIGCLDGRMKSALCPGGKEYPPAAAGTSTSRVVGQVRRSAQ